jgi:hypothetical protein
LFFTKNTIASIWTTSWWVLCRETAASYRENDTNHRITMCGQSTYFFIFKCGGTYSKQLDFKAFNRSIQWPCCLRRGSSAARLLGSHRGHGCMSLVSVVCCQVEASPTSLSLVQRSPTDSGVSLSVIKRNSNLDTETENRSRLKRTTKKKNNRSIKIEKKPSWNFVRGRRCQCAMSIH